MTALVSFLALDAVEMRFRADEQCIAGPGERGTAAVVPFIYSWRASSLFGWVEALRQRAEERK